jgi:uncharacterized integral membrane protein
MQILLVFSLIIAVIAVLFAVQNAASVPVQFLMWKYQAPLALTMLLSVLLGVLISLLFSLPSMTRSKLTIRNQRKKIGELESGLNDAKARLADAQIKSAELEKELTAAKLPPVGKTAQESGAAAPAERPG